MIILFAPKFKDFGVELFERMLLENQELKLVAICTGGAAVVDFVRSRISSDYLLNIYDLEKEELLWTHGAICKNKKRESSVDFKYGVGAFGEVITSDRRVGLGMVRGGLTRPDILGRRSLIDPLNTPINYVNKLFELFEYIFSSFNIGGVFCYAVAGAPTVVLAKICEKERIPFLTLNTTRIADNFIVDTDYKGRLKRIERKLESNEYISKESVDKAKNYLEKYRDKPSNPGYMDYNYSILRKNRVLYFAKEFFKFGAAFLFKFTLPEKYKKKISILSLERKLFDLYTEWNKVTIKKRIFDTKIPDFNYFYFPLHVDPEASTMVMSPMHTDQLSIIESISKGLPSDTILLVKEHRPMLGKRPKNFYKNLRNIPRVKLLSPFLDSREIIKGAEATVVITGTAALEAVLLGRKALVLGSSPYLAMKTGMIYQPCLNFIASALDQIRCLSAPDDDLVIRYLACSFDESFEMKTSLLWGEYKRHLNSEKEIPLDFIARRILMLVDEYEKE